MEQNKATQPVFAEESISQKIEKLSEGGVAELRYD